MSDYLIRAETLWSARSFPRATTGFPYVFTAGACWLHARRNELTGEDRTFDARLPYERYGYLKYVTCLAAALPVGVVAWRWAPVASVLAVPIFYVLEVQTLFLFLLLVDGADQPLQTSIAMTRSVGTLRAVGRVFPIAVYMLSGLLTPRDPFRRWHVGCLAILIWYLDEKR